MNSGSKFDIYVATDRPEQYLGNNKHFRTPEASFFIETTINRHVSIGEGVPDRKRRLYRSGPKSSASSWYAAGIRPACDDPLLRGDPSSTSELINMQRPGREIDRFGADVQVSRSPRERRRPGRYLCTDGRRFFSPLTSLVHRKRSGRAVGEVRGGDSVCFPSGRVDQIGKDQLAIQPAPSSENKRAETVAGRCILIDAESLKTPPAPEIRAGLCVSTYGRFGEAVAMAKEVPRAAGPASARRRGSGVEREARNTELDMLRRSALVISQRQNTECLSSAIKANGGFLYGVGDQLVIFRGIRTDGRMCSGCFWYRMTAQKTETGKWIQKTVKTSSGGRGRVRI
ncbi:hypothetical protein GWI33_006866 [Rhynchophorus ferrugineus]|uniref:Uncharacterized protein n=1 Tax=Rhynchophorus ferrugineus TaxID=354439 RepID=A0A834MF62_RHYFE|nr:hypothetical protein GWI33_006866 [Rhynchophorus ferrugineus]